MKLNTNDSHYNKDNCYKAMKSFTEFIEKNKKIVFLEIGSSIFQSAIRLTGEVFVCNHEINSSLIRINKRIESMTLLDLPDLIHIPKSQLEELIDQEDLDVDELYDRMESKFIKVNFNHFKKIITIQMMSTKC